MCGKYMEALVQCRKEHPYSKFWGACSDITWELSNCLKHEKQVVREPRQKRYHERWSAKREEDAARLEALRQQQRQQQQGGTAAGSGTAAADVGDDDD